MGLQMSYNILVLCDFTRRSANTIIDHATSFKKYSRHNIFYVNPVRREKPEWLNLSKFDVLVIHYSIYVLGDHYINPSWRHSIRVSPAVKIQFIQDEYRRVNEFIDRIKELDIDILYTCFPEQEIERVYPADKLPGVTKINTLTGYVPSYLENRVPDLRSRRPIDVGYRGRGEGFWWLGTLYQEKSIIGKEFLRRATKTELTCDISTREEDRIYGGRWVQFLRQCRCTLGTESGAGVIDFTGQIEDRVRQYCEQHPSVTFEEVRMRFFKDIEGQIRMNQISPRVFESIGCGCGLILFEGEYSKILTPDVHFIPLKKDFSNIEYIFDKIRDRAFIRAMAERSYEDILRSGTYSYRTFISSFDKNLEDYMGSSTGQHAIPAGEGAYALSRGLHGMTANPSGFCARPAGQNQLSGMPSSMTHNTDLAGSQTYIRMLNVTVKSFMFFCRKFGRIPIILYRILRLAWGRIERAIAYRARRLFHLLKQLLQFHPFFLAEKLKLMLKTMRQA